jgi:hypothetical protein
MFMAFALAVVSAGSRAGAGERFSVGDFDFEAPPGWQRVAPPSAMRKAQFRVPALTGGRDGTVVFYRFAPGAGGSTEANIARWRGQFAEPAERLDAHLEQAERQGRPVHIFRASGTFIGDDGQGGRVEVPDYVFFGAILEGASGNVFIRFVAPKALAERNRAAFSALVAGPAD